MWPYTQLDSNQSQNEPVLQVHTTSRWAQTMFNLIHRQPANQKSSRVQPVKSTWPNRMVNSKSTTIPPSHTNPRPSSAICCSREPNPLRSLTLCPLSSVLYHVPWILNPVSCFLCPLCVLIWCLRSQSYVALCPVSCVQFPRSCDLSLGSRFLLPLCVLIYCCLLQPPIPLPFSSRLQLPIFFIIRVHLPASSRV